MSDTIIMYENGKAIGGEGHPTDADSITFDNTGTDIVANKVGSAIKEVNAKFDKGSVSVTADGTKTFSQIFDTLRSLVNVNKITPTSTVTIGTANNYRSFTLCTTGSSEYKFKNTDIISSAGTLTLVALRTSNSAYVDMTFSSAYHDYSNNVMDNGAVVSLYY